MSHVSPSSPQSLHFSHQTAAERYAHGRPRFHQILLPQIRPIIGERKKALAVDIACGTGNSTVALIELADRVVGPEVRRILGSDGWMLVISNRFRTEMVGNPAFHSGPATSSMPGSRHHRATRTPSLTRKRLRTDFALSHKRRTRIRSCSHATT